MKKRTMMTFLIPALLAILTYTSHAQETKQVVPLHETTSPKRGPIRLPDIRLNTSLSADEAFYLRKRSWDQNLVGVDIGWRFRDYSFDQTTKGTPDGVGTFFGSIFRIEEDHDPLPGVLYVQYRPIPYLGVGVTYDTLNAKTRDVQFRGTPRESPGPGDGTVELDGPALYVTAQYPNESIFTPFVELGMIFHDASFNADPDWAARGNRLPLSADDATFFTLGLNVAINGRWSVECFYRTMDAKATGEYRIGDQLRKEDVSFDLSNSAYGVGGRYTF